MAIKYPVSMVNFPVANMGQTVIESVLAHQDKITPEKNTYTIPAVGDAEFKFRPHGDPNWYENKADTYMLSNTILSLLSGYGAVADIFETPSQIYVLTYVFNAGTHSYNLVVLDKTGVNAAIHSLATTAVSTVTVAGTEAVDIYSSRRHFARHGDDILIVLDFDDNQGERVCRVYKNDLDLGSLIKVFADTTHELRDIVVPDIGISPWDDMLVMMFEAPGIPNMQIITVDLNDTANTDEYNYNLSWIAGICYFRSKGSLSVFVWDTSVHIVAVQRCAMLLKLNHDLSVVPSSQGRYQNEFKSFPNKEIHTGVHDNVSTNRMFAIGGDNTLGSYEFVNGGLCESSDELLAVYTGTEINLRDFEFVVNLHFNDFIEDMLDTNDVLFRVHSNLDDTGIEIKLELGAEVEAPYTARLVVIYNPAGAPTTMATSEWFNIHGHDTWRFTVARKGFQWTMTQNYEELTVTGGDSATATPLFYGSEQQGQHIELSSHLNRDRYYYSLEFSADNKRITEMFFKGSNTDGHCIYSGFTNSVGLIRNVFPGIQKVYDNPLMDMRFSSGGLDGTGAVYCVHRTDAESGVSVSALVKYNIYLELLASSGAVSADGASLNEAFFARTLVVSQQDGRVYFGAFMDALTVNRIGLDLSFSVNARRIYFSFMSNDEGIYEGVFESTLDVDLPLYAVCSGVARTLPYGMIVLDEGLRDFYRLADTPVVRTVDTFRMATQAELDDGGIPKYVYNRRTGVFTLSESGRFVLIGRPAKVQSVSQAYTAYVDTPDMYYSADFSVKEEPVSLFVLTGTSEHGVEVYYTLDSNYRFNDDPDIKRCGEEAETGAFENDSVYAHGSKQVEVIEIETIDGRQGRCVKFRLSQHDGSDPEDDPKVDNWRIFELRFTPSNLFVIDGE